MGPSLERSIADAGIADRLAFVQFTQMTEYMLASGLNLASVPGPMVLLRLEDWLREDLKAKSYEAVNDAWVRNEFRLRIEEFVSQFAILSRLSKQVWFIACPSIGWISEEHRVGGLCRTYTSLVVARLRSLPGVVVLNWPASVPADGVIDRQADRLEHVPFSKDAFCQLGEWAGQQLVRTLSRNGANSATRDGKAPELAAYLAGLQVRVRLSRADRADRFHIDRILRTVASFSLTGEKPTISESEIDAVLKAENCFLVAVSDRISEYGPSGLIVFRATADTLTIESFALSCTVLGKQVEYAILSVLGRIASERRCARIEFKYLKSPRNQLMPAFLQQFAERGLETAYVVSVQNLEAQINKVAVNPGAWTVTY